ncbi:hypothetical protein NYQ10_15670 [Flavobacterium johnsoniae]|uniref:Uncharacterized protein n=1 Tax=Flavobacterium sp. CFS9 TaxID=3143118 RepID=A0AAT9H6L3_9FLAO|nr:hypothetical protein [Flavobacterium johnsoniae]WJS93530.1 hypothetical protein NYQ10_15670 [Flavobacterium johnsoniae]
MKRIILKNRLSILAVILAASSAFANSFKPQLEKRRGPAVGYTLNAQQQCDIAVACDDNPSPFICRLGGTTGPIAYGKNAQGQCVITLWRPF